MIKLFWIFGSDSNLNDSLNALLLLEMTSFSISGHPFSFLSFISSNDFQKNMLMMFGIFHLVFLISGIQIYPLNIYEQFYQLKLIILPL